MDNKEIKEARLNLEQQLKVALSDMRLKEDIPAIRSSLKALQSICFHEEGKKVCPYCGKDLT